MASRLAVAVTPPSTVAIFLNGTQYALALNSNTVNMAARLESMTRSTGRALMFGESVKNACLETWPWEEMGQLQLKGESAVCSYFSLKDDIVHDTRSVDDMINHVLSTTEEHRRNCVC
jgi:class 3 adenylate cyclase